MARITFDDDTLRVLADATASHRDVLLRRRWSAWSRYDLAAVANTDDDLDALARIESAAARRRT